MRWTAVVLAMLALPALAQSVPTPRDLPPTVAARQWIDQDPAVQEARRALQAARHSAAMLRAGSHEWTTRIQGQRRNYREGGGNSKEWSVQLEKGIRINGKAGLDREIGEAEISIAEARLGESIHEAAQALLDLWIDGLAAVEAEALYRQQLESAQQNLRAVESRRKAGDASALDQSMATSDAAEVERLASQAASNLEKTRAKLRVRFPGAQLPNLALEEPRPPEGAELQWLTRVLDSSDLLRTTQGQLRRAELNAARASADRIPDPTVGFFAASEGFRQERIVGISVSIPLSGTYRSERAQQALQEAEAARSTVERQRRELETRVVETYADATGQATRWRLAEKGTSAASENARLTNRAYSLGEADLQSLLLARRQFLEAARASLESRVEALRAQYRLLIDSHLIWDLSQD